MEVVRESGLFFFGVHLRWKGDAEIRGGAEIRRGFWVGYLGEEERERRHRWRLFLHGEKGRVFTEMHGGLVWLR